MLRFFWLGVLAKAHSSSVLSNKRFAREMWSYVRGPNGKEPRYRLPSCTRGTDRRYSWTAVCVGATRWGLERSRDMIETRKARYSYGVITTTPYDPSNHHNEDGFWDPVRATERAHRIHWLVKKVCNCSPR